MRSEKAYRSAGVDPTEAMKGGDMSLGAVRAHGSSERRSGPSYALPVVVVALAAASVLAGAPPLVVLALLALAVAATGLLSYLLHRARRLSRRHDSAARAVSAYSSGAICLTDGAGHVLSLNPAAERLLAISAQEATGRPAWDVIHLGDRDGADSGWLQLALAGDQSRGQGYVTLGGRTAPVAYTAGPIVMDGHVTGAALLFSETSDIEESEARRRAEAQYRTLIESSPDGMLLTDPYGYIQFANQRAAALHGWEEGDALAGKRLVELIDPAMRVALSHGMRRVAEDGQIAVYDYAALRRDGDVFPAEAAVSRVIDGGEVRGLLLVVRDISRHKLAEAALRATQERADLQQVVADVLAHATSLGDAMPRLLRALGDSGGWDGALLWQLDGREDRLHCPFAWSRPGAGLEPYINGGLTAALKPGNGPVGESAVHGQAVWVGESDLHAESCPVPGTSEIRTVFCFPLRAGGETQGVIEFIDRESRPRDAGVTETLESVSTAIGQFIKRKQAERELEYRAHHDALTALPNRDLFNIRLERALSVAAVSHHSLAVLLMDMDRFKEVNDTFGHLHGDALLKQAATRLSAVLRDSDTVARLGGDEFAVLLPVTDEEGARAAAEKLLRCVEKPFPVEQELLDVGISIGVAMYPDHGRDPGALLQHADVAMYQAKREKLGVAVYAADDDYHTPTRFALQGDLRRAIEHGELFLVYQPKIDVRTGEVASVEALVRWNHPENGLIAPGDFIPLAEHTGLVGPLTVWVLRDALRQLAMWLDSGIDLRIAVNLSAQNLHDPQLVSAVQDLLDERGIEPGRLVLEVTESAIMINADRARQVLEALNRLGVAISIDDFGTGYSSLSYLHHLPAQEIKIDKSFVLDMLNEGDGAFIARSVIDLGHNFGHQVVAEGVENVETYELLDAMRCDHVQGFYFTPPLPAGELTRWMQERTAAFRGKGHLRRLDTA